MHFLAVTLALLYLSGIETPSRNVLLAVLGICGGTAMASIGEGSFNVVGLGLMLLAEVAEATRLVLTQRLLKNLKFGVSAALACQAHYMPPTLTCLCT